ncbi:class I tRNA ligase family protein [Candidatus Kaiserbacteria bacterium]|nr:class I tRNA ligase family protein [Candidatus Kaiserbacteria bacterium]
MQEGREIKKTPSGEKTDTAKREEEVLQFWKENGIFEKSLAKEAPNGEFVFYDGPPFATGLPHYGHVLGSTVKDVIPRYKTMCGFHVRRVWGWDCHGLPIENMIEKELGLKSKKDILEMGIDTFNEACRAAVMRFADEWEKYVDRIGRWVEFRGAYKTMDNSYIESTWWALKQIYEKGLLYEGRKVLLYCPHCETPLSKAEIAMDNSYKEDLTQAVTVKFKIENPEKLGLQGDTYLLAWTTTPWTLPGNVALAVRPDIKYVLVCTLNVSKRAKEGLVEYENVIIAEDIFENLYSEKNTDPKKLGFGLVYAHHQKEGEEPIKGPESVKTFLGSDLEGLSYRPLFDIPKVVAQQKEKAFTVLPADFVTTTEGTGIVHTAVIYGEDDYQLGLANDLPMVPLLDASGNFNDDAPSEIRRQYFKKAEKTIIEYLDSKNLIFTEEYTHSYPHCHRCGTALIYNALVSWFINIQKVKDRMLATNEDINWVPSHLKEGRYKNIVENAPDWTISRNRFWASPMPIWKNAETGALTVIGSFEELEKHTKRSGNTYFLMRHGEALSNTTNTHNHDLSVKNPLTEKGKQEVERTAEMLKDKNIQYIYTSPMERARETAAMLANTLGLSADRIVVHNGLTEVNGGIFEGKPISDYHAYFATRTERLTKTPEDGENWMDTKRNITSVLYEIEEKHAGAGVVLVSHNGPLQMLQAGAKGLDTAETAKIMEDKAYFVEPGDVREFDFTPLPHNKDYELDFHRPYIDGVTLVDESGAELARAPEVIDGWVESGSMPFAERHYPFESTDEFEPKENKAYPADFIAEYIAQTRTWFYYMHAVSVLLFDKPSFKNVVTTGTILAADGSKMSKSKKNFTDPLLVVDQFGADALRYYLMSSVVMQAEDMNFRDEELREAHNRVVQMLWNTYTFYDMYKGDSLSEKLPDESSSVLDRWILARLNQLVAETTDAFEIYDMPRATRPIREFVEDFSTWYIRRSRDRFKSEDAKDRAYAVATTRYVLLTLSKLIAPVMPFIAESIYKGAGGEKESVHLETWPEAGQVDTKLIEDMSDVRNIVSLALEARSKAGIKVRQPLAGVIVRVDSVIFENQALIELVKDEINVKEVVSTRTWSESVVLDTTITESLKQEGMARELMRAIQELRKTEGLAPSDRIALIIKAPEEGKTMIETHRADIMRTTGADVLLLADTEGTPVTIDGAQYVVRVEKK